jgi:hypothetical protein
MTIWAEIANDDCIVWLAQAGRVAPRTDEGLFQRRQPRWHDKPQYTCGKDRDGQGDP